MKDKLSIHEPRHKGFKITGIDIILYLILLINIEKLETASQYPISTLAAKYHILIGAITTDHFWELHDTSTYQAIYKREFNILTPENALKFAYLQPQRGVFDFAIADRHVHFAEQNGIAIHGHTLFWHLDNPTWLDNG